MTVIITRSEAQELRSEIHAVLFPQRNDGKKVMCAIFPSNGLYVAEGFAREVLAHNTLNVDMSDYLLAMSVRDFFDLKAVAGLAEEQQDGRRE